MTDFVGFPKIARLNRDVVVTEKIDGTNAAVVIEEIPYLPKGSTYADSDTVVEVHSGPGEAAAYVIAAQSRNRLITPQQDNFGFAKWVEDNAAGLVKALGPGRHFGEWWGHGIQRGYGLKQGDRRFSLFNVSTPVDNDAVKLVPGLGFVPVLAKATGDWLNTSVAVAMKSLGDFGSQAAPGFDKPEGVVVYHTASKALYKRTFEHDEQGKERG